MNIDVVTPEIFPRDKVVAGVTKINKDLFPGKGLTFPTETLFSDEKAINHKIILAEFLGTGHENLKFQKQVHGIDIITVGSDYVFDEADGMITREKGIYLCVRTADCAAVLIYDPVNEVLCALHSGWRGTRQNISALGIAKMTGEYNSDPASLLAWVTPCASGGNYEVGPDVAQYFPNSIKPIENGKFLFDNKKQINIQLLASGLLGGNIEVSGLCTMTDTDYHSYRRDGNNAGRLAAYIGMKH